MRACPTCGELRDDYQSVDVRIEFRRLRKYDRERVVGIGYSCTACSREIAELLRKNEPGKARVMRAVLEAARDAAAARERQGRLV